MGAWRQRGTGKYNQQNFQRFEEVAGAGRGMVGTEAGGKPIAGDLEGAGQGFEGLREVGGVGSP